MKKGFTLIELLAVIVVLAIIALIAVPVVLNIINDSKESSLLRSAEFYLSAVDYTIANAFLYHGGLSNGEYPITPEGNICKKALPCDDANTLKVEVNGDKPTGGTITIDGGTISDVEITLGGRSISKNKDGNLVYTVCKKISGDKNTPGSKYECEVKPGTKYNFYVLSQESDGTTNLIMDRNICEDGTTIGSNCFTAYIANITCPSEGPIDIMNFLNNATKDWVNIPNLDISYDDESYIEGACYTDYMITGKARPLYQHEARALGCEDWSEAVTCPIWLYDYTDDTDEDDDGNYPKPNVLSGVDGHWTLSAYSDYAGAYAISKKGHIYPEGANVKQGIGVRPVINIEL